MINGNVDDHHQNELMAVGSGGREYSIAVISTTEIAPDLIDGAILADFDHGIVGTSKRIENFADATRISKNLYLQLSAIRHDMIKMLYRKV